MKIVMIITGLRVGGAEASLLNIVKALDERFRVHVISLADEGAIGPQISALGIPVETLGMTPGWPSFVPGLVRLARRLRELKPDVVHTWMYHADFLGGLAARLAGVPAVVWMVHIFNLEPRYVKPTTRFVVKLCAILSRVVPTKIISCSQAATGVHVDVGYDPEKMIVLPNGIDTARFHRDESARSSVRAELGIPQDAHLVGVIGRFDAVKNHAGFFEAAAMVHRKCGGVHFLLAGNGVEPDNAALNRVMIASGVAGVTHMLGPRSDVPRLMSALDVLVSSSLGEAFPMVVGEAMACEVPCAVTDVGDSAYIVGDTGYVVRSGDMAALAAAIEKLLLLPWMSRSSLGIRARSRVHEKFDMHTIVKGYERLYDDVARAGSRRAPQ